MFNNYFYYSVFSAIMMAKKNTKCEHVQSDTTLGVCVSYYPFLAKDGPLPKPQQKDQSKKQPFTPGNSRIFPLKGPENSVVYEPPQSTYNLFYIDSVRQGIWEGAIVINDNETKEKATKLIEGRGDTLSKHRIDKGKLEKEPIQEDENAQKNPDKLGIKPSKLKSNDQKDREKAKIKNTPENGNNSPEHFETPIEDFSYNSTSPEISHTSPEVYEREVLRASAPFYFRDEDSHELRHEAKSRASLDEARKQFFEPLYHHADAADSNRVHSDVVDYSQSTHSY